MYLWDSKRGKKRGDIMDGRRRRDGRWTDTGREWWMRRKSMWDVIEIDGGLCPDAVHPSNWSSEWFPELRRIEKKNAMWFRRCFPFWLSGDIGWWRWKEKMRKVGLEMSRHSGWKEEKAMQKVKDPFYIAMVFESSSWVGIGHQRNLLLHGSLRWQIILQGQPEQ